MAQRSVVALSVIVGVLAVSVAAGSIAIATTTSATSPTRATTPTSSPSTSPSTSTATTPTPDPAATSPSDVLLAASGQDAADAPVPVADDASPAPDVVPNPAPGEHVVTFQVTSSEDPVQVSYYTVGGNPSSSDSSSWVYGESQTSPVWVTAPWTHSVIIPVGGDPMKDGWGLSIFVRAGVQATCQVTMDGAVISRSSVSADGPTLWSCRPGVVN